MEQQREKDSEFVQIRLWDDCLNNCSFCSLQNRLRKTTTQSKKVRLRKSTELVRTFNSRQIGLLGGEFFEEQLKGCEDEWAELMKALLNTGAKLCLTASLIHKQHLLEETIELLGDRLTICTSYDEVGRFHTEAARANWFNNIEKLHEQGVNLFCTCIPTQEFFEAAYPLPDWLGVNFNDPHLGVDWLINIDKSDYHERLLAENDRFNLPKRRTAIHWMREHPQLMRNYTSYELTHSNTVYAFDEDDCLIIEMEGRREFDSCFNQSCGHPCFCQCYADSNKCMMCDAKHIVEPA